MKRILLSGALAALMAFTSSASAQNFLTNGDWSTGTEAGWTRWGSGRPNEIWGVTNVGPTAPEGSLTGYSGNTPSYGWYQVAAIPAGLPASVGGDWMGNSVGWAEVMLWTVNSAPTHAQVNTRADAGANADIAYKRDAFGAYTPTWPWQSVTLSPHAGGNGGTVVSQGYVVMALKLGNHTSNQATALRYDNMKLTPEPAAALLLLAGLPLMRRRRA